MQTFTYQDRSEEAPAQVFAGVLRVWTPRMQEYGYRLTSQTTLADLAYERRYRTGWTIALAILTFPIGLLFLLRTRTVYVTFTFHPTGDGTLVTISGEGLYSVRAELARAAHAPAPEWRGGLAPPDRPAAGF